MFSEDQLLPISALQHLRFCERRAALVHIEGLWAENRFTAEGNQLHAKAHDPSRGETRPGLRVVRGMALRSLALGLSGKADVVELHVDDAGQTTSATIVEYKRGSPKSRLDREFRIQLCAQALCLEEMMPDIPIDTAIFYGQTRRRIDVELSGELRQTLDQLAQPLPLDVLRGQEGENSAVYFNVFNHLITAQGDAFAFTGRSRRPPLDRTNALLSFLYSMLAHDARSACEAAGLDAAVGFLHRDRPGRPSLALDLMEELRPLLADRLALSLINRQQVKAAGFVIEPAGGVRMDDATRKTVITAYQKRKQEILRHPYLDEKVTLGLIVHLQARLLARYLRGDLDAYPPFVWR